MDKLALSLIAVGLTWSGASLADVASGPDAGSKVEELKVEVAVGDDKGKEVDVADQRKEKLTVYLFVAADRFDRPTARFMRELDKQIKEKYEDARIEAVWLADEIDASKERLPKVQTSIKLEKTGYNVFKGASGPNGWGINTDAHVTAVIANDAKVAKSLAWRSLNETDVEAVVKELEEAKETKETEETKE